MKSSKIGFLAPDNKLVWLEYDQVNEFCREVCVCDIYRERFEKFKQDYSYFEPYFDFVMFELEYIMVNGLCRNSCIMKFENALYELLDSKNLSNFDYNSLKSDNIGDYYAVPLITKCSDSELELHSISFDNLDACMINYQGVCMMSHSGLADEDRGCHALTSRTVLNQILSQNREIVEDYLSYNKKTVDYLVDRLGFVRTTNKDEGGYIIGNSKVMNEDIYQVLSSVAGFTFEDSSKIEESRKTRRG